MSAAEQSYRLLLRAYPRRFRVSYEREMVLVFRDQHRERSGTRARFWAEMVWDVARSAPALRAEAWRARWSEETQTLEVIMKLAAGVTVLLGVFVAVSALVEALAAAGGGGTLEGSHLIAIVLGAIAGALLLTAGIALLRGTPSSRQVAGLAAIAALVLVVTTRFLHPWMSIASQLVGFGLPIVLLATLHWPHQRGPSARGTA